MADKIYIIYKTTNLLNNKIYIGFHGTDNINDGYLGSGRVFLKALKRYGKENFKKEILFTFENKVDALKKEAELVSADFIKQGENYNCTLGGLGGVGKSNKGYKHSVDAINKIKEAGKRKCKTETKVKIGLANSGKKRSKELVDKHSEFMKQYYRERPSHRLGVKHTEEVKKRISETKKGSVFSDETKLKMSKSMRGKQHAGKRIINKLTSETYKSQREASKALNIPERTLYRNLKKENYFLRHE